MRVLLSLFIVDKVARSVAMMLSCDCFVNLSISFLICSTMLSTVDSGKSAHASHALRFGFLASPSSVLVAACTVGSVVVFPVPPLSWSDRSMVSFFLGCCIA